LKTYKELLSQQFLGLNIYVSRKFYIDIKVNTHIVHLQHMEINYKH
jgi:hypothetical protein